MAAGFGIGLATVYRYVREAVALLAGLGRSLTAALWTLAWTCSNFAVLDGTLVRTTRIRVHDRRYHAGKHRHHGVNRQGLTDPHGRLIWIFDGLPGSVHDLTAARTPGVFTVAARAELHLYADKGYAGGEGPLLLTPYKGRSLPDSYRQANRCHAAVRAHGERGFAVLKSWKVFDRFRRCPRHLGAYGRAAPTREHGPSKGTWKKLTVAGQRRPVGGRDDRPARAVLALRPVCAVLRKQCRVLGARLGRWR